MAREIAERTQNAIAQQNEAPTVAQLLERMKPEIAKALPKHMSPERLARMALTTLRLNPGLQRCKPESFLGALMTCSQLGLEPGPLGEAWFVPYGNEVTFIPGYRGLIKLAWNSGQLSSIAAHVVREGDEFDFEYGLNPFLKHRPSLESPRGNVFAVYAAATFKSGGNAFWVMSKDDVEDIRKQSKAASKGPWVTHWDAMARKTAIRQLIRFLPLSTELQPLELASRLDESVRTNILTPVDEAPVGYITGDLVETEQGLTDPESGEVVEPTVVEDPPDVPDGW